jgi:3-methyl-2-oxobutanoate hydroxymethyltransferase
MKRIYTFGHEQVDRNITVGDMLDNKKNDIKMTQVTAGNQEEAEIVASQDIDMIITGSDWYQDVRKGAPNTFITAALFAGRFVTNEEILRGAFDVMMNGADSVLTPRSMDVVEMLAKEGMQVQGHVGMVPSMATKYGGIRTVGKTADEAISILKDMKRLEMLEHLELKLSALQKMHLLNLKNILTSFKFSWFRVQAEMLCFSSLKIYVVKLQELKCHVMLNHGEMENQ